MSSSSIFPDEPPRRSPSSDDVTRFSPTDTTESHDDHDFDLTESSALPGDAPLGTLGEYLLIEQIGSGGMGKVYRAEHRTMNRQVALKILSSSIANRPKLLEQFFSEIRAVAKLMHPNIVTAFDAGSVGDIHYLVMELVEGEVLSSRIRQGGPFNSSEAVNFLEQAASALAYAHRCGVVHRDIKPSNMMLTREGTLKILDFGLASIESRTAEASGNKNMFMGTPEYMSPEQIRNADQVDGRSDLYSLGATLFNVLTGRTMFSGDKMQVAMAQLRQKPEALYLVRGDVDLRLDAVFQRLVAKAPADRYSSAEQLTEDLARMNLSSQPAKANVFSKGASRLGGDNPTSVAFTKSTIVKKSQIVAIDLGMLVSTASFMDTQAGPQVIQLTAGSTPHLRNMWWSKGEQTKIGAEAVAQRQSAPEHIMHSVQRWIGAKQVAWSFAGRRAPPEVILAGLLRHVMNQSAGATDGADTAIVTVPSCYDQLHRRAIRNACRIADINLVQLLDKPLAAALAWLDLDMRLSHAPAPEAANSKLLVVHLGGSALEASVIQVRGLTVQQLGTSGSWKSGSLRWHNRLAEYLALQLREQTGKSIREDVLAATRLQRTIEIAMDRLTRESKVAVRFEWLGTTIDQVITQDGLFKIAAELPAAIDSAIQGACQAAKTDPSEIDRVLLVGGMMGIKPLRSVISQALPHAPPMSVLDKSDLSRGAAIQSQHFTAESRADCLHARAVGCAAYDLAVLRTDAVGKHSTPRVLLERGTKLPTVVTRTLRPSLLSGSDSASFPTLQIIESTGLGDSNWLRLGQAKPDELFPRRPPSDPLQLRLGIDESGILESSLIWPDGNRQVEVADSSDPSLTEDDIASWRDWLETIFLCS